MIWVQCALPGGSGFHHTKGFAIHDWRKTSFSIYRSRWNFRTTRGSETFATTKLDTAITAFPLREISRNTSFATMSHPGRKPTRCDSGLNVIHEPVLRGALAGKPETLFYYPRTPVLTGGIRQYWRAARIRFRLTGSQLPGLVQGRTLQGQGTARFRKRFGVGLYAQESGG